MWTYTVFPRFETISHLFSKVAHTAIIAIPTIFLARKQPSFRSRSFANWYHNAIPATTALEYKPIPISILPGSIPTHFLRPPHTSIPNPHPLNPNPAHPFPVFMPSHANPKRPSHVHFDELSDVESQGMVSTKPRSIVLASCTNTTSPSFGGQWSSWSGMAYSQLQRRRRQYHSSPTSSLYQLQ